MLIKPFAPVSELSAVAGNLNIIYDGSITNDEGEEITLSNFRSITGIEVYDINTLIIVGTSSLIGFRLIGRVLNLYVKLRV
jgi:hypothetical protein